MIDIDASKFVAVQPGFYLTASPAALKSKPTRAQIDRLEAEVKALPQVQIETRHHFAPGVYAREIRIPKGATLTGLIHLSEHLNIISKGALMVITGEGMRLVGAGSHIVSKPGTKRAGYAVEDTVWTTIIQTEETDISKIESMFVVGTFEEFDAIGVSVQRALEKEH